MPEESHCLSLFLWFFFFARLPKLQNSYIFLLHIKQHGQESYVLLIKMLFFSFPCFLVFRENVNFKTMRKNNYFSWIKWLVTPTKLHSISFILFVTKYLWILFLSFLQVLFEISCSSNKKIIEVVKKEEEKNQSMYRFHIHSEVGLFFEFMNGFSILVCIQNVYVLIEFAIFSKNFLTIFCWIQFLKTIDKVYCVP